MEKWKTIDDKITIEDVGGKLIDNLAKGMYKPHEVIREYVQNARDAYYFSGHFPERIINIQLTE